VTQEGKEVWPFVKTYRALNVFVMLRGMLKTLKQQQYQEPKDELCPSQQLTVLTANGAYS